MVKHFVPPHPFCPILPPRDDMVLVFGAGISIQCTCGQNSFEYNTFYMQNEVPYHLHITLLFLLIFECTSHTTQ